MPVRPIRWGGAEVRQRGAIAERLTTILIVRRLTAISTILAAVQLPPISLSSSSSTNAIHDE